MFCSDESGLSLDRGWPGGNRPAKLDLIRRLRNRVTKVHLAARNKNSCHSNFILPSLVTSRVISSICTWSITNQQLLIFSDFLNLSKNFGPEKSGKLILTSIYHNQPDHENYSFMFFTFFSFRKWRIEPLKGPQRSRELIPSFWSKKLSDREFMSVATGRKNVLLLLRSCL